MATRKPSLELYYDPADLDPAAPRLHIRKNGSGWELRDADCALLSSHAKLPEAIDAAEERSRVCFCEILVQGAASPIEWSVRLNPAMVELARVMNQPVAVEREAAGARQRVGVGAFPGHHVFLPARRRFKNSPIPVELYYDPADLDPAAPRLHIRKNGSGWELRDADDALLSRSMLLPDVLDAALERSNVRFSEIIVQGARGGMEWSVHHNPECVELARLLARERATWPASLIAAMDAGSLQLTFDPGEVDGRAPKLHVRVENGEWEIRSVSGVLSTHPTQEEALATARSRVPDCGAEIFFESRSGRFLHRVARSPAELHYLDVCQSLYEDHHALVD